MQVVLLIVHDGVRDRTDSWEQPSPEEGGRARDGSRRTAVSDQLMTEKI